MVPAAPSDVDALVAHLFRHSAGQKVSWLARWLGSARLDLAEEAAQDALCSAPERRFLEKQLARCGHR